jgi:hypothetical protein
MRDKTIGASASGRPAPQELDVHGAARECAALPQEDDICRENPPLRLT